MICAARRGASLQLSCADEEAVHLAILAARSSMTPRLMLPFGNEIHGLVRRFLTGECRTTDPE